MSANVFRFRRLPLLCAGMFSAAVSAAQESRVLPDPVVPSSSVQESSVPSSSVQESSVPSSSVQESSVSEFFAPATAVRLSSVPERRPLDSREHRGYTSWKRLLPTHVKAQYAGGMGFLSVGYGWDYGRKCRWETDLMFGVLPKSCSDRTHLTFTLKQNYIPWSIRCRDWLSVEPFSCGAYLNLISGEDFWIREPDRYPGDRYYDFTSRIRFHLYAGQRVTFRTKRESLLRHITLYYEFSANDLDLVAKFGNRTLSFTDIVYFSVGIKFQLFGMSL